MKECEKRKHERNIPEKPRRQYSWYLSLLSGARGGLCRIAWMLHYAYTLLDNALEASELIIKDKWMTQTGNLTFEQGTAALCKCYSMLLYLAPVIEAYVVMHMTTYSST
jgi:hypothetical protein